MNISGYFNQYVACSCLAPTSVESYSRAVRYLIQAAGDIDPGEVNFGIAEDYLNYLRKGRAAGSINSYLRYIKAFFAWLGHREKIKSNPFKNIRLLPTDEIYRPPYTGNELTRILKVADLRLQVIVLLAVFSGLRRSEILNLIVKDIYFDTCSILISPKKDTETTWWWNIKNHQSAFVPLPETVWLPDGQVNIHNKIIQLIETLPSRQPYLCLKPSQYQQTLALNNAGKLTYRRRIEPWQGFSNTFRRLCKRAMVETKTLRDLRMSFATNLAENGMSLTEIQEMLRHKSAQTTATYYIRHNQQKIIGKVNELSKKCYATNVS